MNQPCIRGGYRNYYHHPDYEYCHRQITNCDMVEAYSFSIHAIRENQHKHKLL